MSPDCDFEETTYPLENAVAWRFSRRSDFGPRCAGSPAVAGVKWGVARPASTGDRIIRQLWRAVRSLDPADAEKRLEAAEQNLLLEDVEGAKHCYGNLFAVRAALLAREDDTLNASAAAEQALRRGAQKEFRGLAGLVLRYCSWTGGAATATPGAPETTGSLRHNSPGQLLLDVLQLTLAGAIEFSGLQVAAAERLARAALQRAQCLSGLSILPTSVLAKILYEQGQLEEAAQLLQRRLPDIRTLGGLDCVSHAYSVLARIAAHDGDRGSALALLDEGRKLAEARNWPRLLAVILSERIRLCGPREEGRAAIWLAQLHNLAERNKPLTRCSRSEIGCNLYRAQLYSFWTFRTGSSPRTALAHLRRDAWLSQDAHASAWVDLAEAQVRWIEGDPEGSLGYLTKTLRVVETTGLRQQLADAGPALPAVVRHFTETVGIDPSLRAVASCVTDRPSLAEACAQERSQRGSVGGDSLTTREREVLKLIGEGCTNKIIAQIQGVSPETIKTQVKNIFVKLGVERRAQAVSKAERLGLLPPSNATESLKHHGFG